MKTASNTLCLSIVCGLLAGVMACGAKQSNSEGSLKTIAPVVNVPDATEEVVCLAPGIELIETGEYLCANPKGFGDKCRFEGPEGLAEIEAKKCNVVIGDIHLGYINGLVEAGTKPFSEYPAAAPLTNLDSLLTVKVIKGWKKIDGTMETGSISVIDNQFLTSLEGLSNLKTVGQVSISLQGQLETEILDLQFDDIRKFWFYGGNSSFPRVLNLNIVQIDELTIGNSTHNLAGLESINFTAPKPVKIGKGFSVTCGPALTKVPSISQIAADSFLGGAKTYDYFLGFLENYSLCQEEAISKELWKNRFPYLPDDVIELWENCII